MKYLILIITLCLSACSPTTLSDEEFQAYLSKKECTITNEFVGKDADRLYLCSDGIKYKSFTLWSSAWDEKANKK